MTKKRGTFRLNGVGTKMEQHAERVLRLVTLNSPHASPLAYESLLFLEQRDPERFKTLMSDATVAGLYDRFDTRRKARKQAAGAARVAEQPRQEIERTAASAERKRRKLALSGEGALSEQHIERVKRLWSVLLEKNHNMYQYRTRVAFAESMHWLEENESKEFLTLLESLEDMSNGDDAYFIFIRHELNQIQKQVAASHQKLDMDLLAPRRRKKTEAYLKKSTTRSETEKLKDDVAADELYSDQTVISDPLEKDL